MLTWNPEWGPGDVIIVLALLTAAAGLWFTARQVRENTKVRRAQFLMDATDRYFLDTEVRKLYYDIDYGKFKIEFNDRGEPVNFRRGEREPQPFIGSAEERCLDNLLYTFDTIGRIVEIGALDRKEAELFTFQANRVFSDVSVDRLLTWLDKERMRFGGEIPTHKAGRALAAKQRHIKG